METQLKKFYLTVFSFLLISTLAVSQPSNKLEPIDVFDIEYVSNPEISPKGNKILFQRNFKDIMTDKNLSNLWIVNFDGSGMMPITTGDNNAFSPKWSHSGNMFTYKSNIEGSTQLYLYNLENNSTQRLTNIQSSIGNVEWSSDDKYLLFNSFVESTDSRFIKMPKKPKGADWNSPPIEIDDMVYRYDGGGYRRSGNNQIFILPVEGGTPRQVSSLEKNPSSAVWLGRDKVLFSANLHDNSDFEPNNSEIYVLDIKSGEVKQLTTRFGPDMSPVVSPDNSKIAFLGYDDKYLSYQQNSLYVMDADGSNVKLVSEGFDRNIGNRCIACHRKTEVNAINWMRDGKGLYFQYDTEGMTKISSISLSGKVKDIVDEVGGLSFGTPYSGGSYTISPSGRYAFTYGNVYNPADLAVGYNGSKDRLTYLNKDLFDYKELGRVEEVWYESSYDGKKIQGWLVYPPNFDPAINYPLILEIHGGPFLNYGFRFSAEVQLFAGEGYFVLYTNPRGSTSYGKDFANLIHHNYPSQDYDDLMSGVDHVIKRDYIDGDNLFVTGGSGGGVLTSWIVGKTDRFRAAVVEKPVINWYSFVLYADKISFFYKYWFPGMPWDNLEEYMKRSPISYVGNVTTPTMLLTGEDDYRTPIAESEQFYAGLKLNKVESMLVRIPGAGHGISARPSNQIAKVNAIITWFDKYKK
tara:strand:+ start:622 stop:2691 length:2070 start_codon:yes stop_codon:yes gene_type:complete